jgi:iduronate 2-sulfatase
MHKPENLPVLTAQRVIPNTPKYALSNNSELTHYVDLIDLPKPWDDEAVSLDQSRHLMHAYYACVSYVDAQIGRLLKALDEEGLAENTIVVLWSDHGWKLGEYRAWGKMTNYEIDARVPLIISAPGMKTAGQKTDQLAELLDVYPTLCDLAGIDKPDFLDGSSLAPILNDASMKVHEGAVNQYYRKFNGQEYMGYSIRTHEYRLVEWREFATGKVTARELYDHRNRHTEDVNIVDDVAEAVIESLTEELLKTHPRRGLVMTPAVHTDPTAGRWKVKFTFRNETQGEVSVYNIGSTGRRANSKRLRPGEDVTYNARIGGVFVVESKDGRIYEIHSPSLPARTVVIEEQP